MTKNFIRTQIFMFLFFAASFLEAQTTIPASDWEMYRDPTNVPAVPLIAQPANWDAAMSFQNIPDENSGLWGAATQFGNWSAGWNVGSTIPSCNNFMQFGYLQTSLDIPANAINLSLSMTGQPDDLARAYVFNSEHPNGGHISDRDGFWRLWFDPAPKDLSSFLVAGEINRIVVVHIDWCPSGNSLGINAMYDWDLGVTDVDNDGVDDEDDECPDTPAGEDVNADGCSCSQLTIDDGDPCTLDECVNGVVTNTFQDADGDGVCDANDACPGGNDNDDMDGDGTPDFCDDDIDGDGFENGCDSEPEYNNYTYTSYNDLPQSWKCGNNKVFICHGSNNPHTNCVNKNAVPAHLNHGDYLGPCNCTGQNLIAPGINVNATTTAEQFELEVFPNPTNGLVNIHLHGLEAAATLTIYDNLGRAVWTQQVAEGQHALQINLNNNDFRNGIYLISVISNGEQLTRRMVVTQ